MTDDYTDLVKRLRDRHLAWEGAEQYGSLDEAAADAIEAQAARMEELNEQLRLANMDCFIAESRITLLEEIVVCAAGDFRNDRHQEAFDRLRIEEKIITALEGKEDE